MFRLHALLLLSFVALAGCGGSSDLPHSDQASVSITPAISSIQAGGTIALQGTTTGFTAAPFFDWWQQDHHDHTGINGSANCDNVAPHDFAFGEANCPYGFLVVEPTQTTSTTATYHAPLTPGTYHVTLRAVQISSTQLYETLEKRASATISVTP